ncbi:MAG: redox-regulated ATPase YchF [Patescibacteria group bacterium]
MSLRVGIVGLPNVGKSTLFNALLKRQAAYVANFPFATIEPNIGIVPVPDERLEKLADVIFTSEVSARPPIVPATVEFVDIAGLVAGAHKGEGLGNKFLAHIREVDAIVHVVRDFEDENVVRAGSVSPKEDLEIVKTELDLADLETVEKIKSKNEKRQSEKEKSIEDQTFLFRNKPEIIVYNVSEEEYGQKYNDRTTNVQDNALCISAKLEEELAVLSEDERKQYLKDMGIEETGLERLIKKAFATLGLITFLTAGVKEVRAWTIKRGTNAVLASGVIHTDFMDKFIKAEVVDFQDFVGCGGWKGAREKGKARLEGKDYIVKDGDVIEFKIGS